MYTYKKAGEYLQIFKDGKEVITPGGNPVLTSIEPLAKKLVEDLKVHGEDPSLPESLVAFHYPMVDFFRTMPREQLEASVATGLARESDWTFQCPSAAPEMVMEWMGHFGNHSANAEKAKEWLSTLTEMQLCAVCVLGRALESVNIPYLITHAYLKPKDLKTFLKVIDKFFPYVGIPKLGAYVKTYHLYYSFGTRPK